MKAKVLVLTNMLPEKDDYFGIFVQKNIQGLQKEFYVKTLFVKNSKNKIQRLFYYFHFFIKVLFEKKHKYDLVYIHFPTRTAFPLLFHFNSKKKVVINFHGSDLIFASKINFLIFSIQKRWFQKARLIIVPSSHYKTIASQYFNQKKILISPSSGVPDNFFNLIKNNPPKFEFTYISTVNEEKGAFDACKAVLEVAKYHQNIGLEIYGKVEGRNKLLLDKFTCTRYINYNGVITQSNIVNIMKKSYCFLFPSKRESESLGLVGIEALATGTPVIGSDIPAIKTYLKNGVNGLIFEAGNIESLVKNIEELIINDDLYMKLKENTTSSVTKFKESIVQEELNSILKKLIN